MTDLVRFENGDVETVEDEDFGLYYPVGYVISTWQAYKRFGILPVRGGYNDQDELLMQDWYTLDSRYQIAIQNAKGGDLLGSSSNRVSLGEF